MDLIPYIIGAAVALIGAGGLRLLFARRTGSTEQATQPVPPAPPEHTAQEHSNASIDEQIDAIVEAAAEHNVDVGTVADDLDWLGADDV